MATSLPLSLKGGVYSHALAYQTVLLLAPILRSSLLVHGMPGIPAQSVLFVRVSHWLENTRGHARTLK